MVSLDVYFMNLASWGLPDRTLAGSTASHEKLKSDD